MNDNLKAKQSEGKFQEVTGAIKKKVGALLGNEKMEREGRSAELAGKTDQAVANAGQVAKGAVERVVGTVENRVGHVIDSDKMIAEGRATAGKGRARQKAAK